MTNCYERVRGSKWAFCGIITVVLIAAGCTQQAPPADTRAADESAIRDLDAQWSKTAGAHDLEGTLAYYTDDAAVMASNVPVANTKEAIRAIWAPMCAKNASVSWQVNKIDVARSSDLAYSTGVYDLEISDPQGKGEKDRGKFLEVWKKQADGKWKVVADIFNTDLPLPAPPETKKK